MPPMLRRGAASLAASAIILTVNQSFALTAVPRDAVSPADGWSDADVADVHADAPIVVHVRIAEAIPIKDSASPAGTRRTFFRGDVIALIRGAAAVAPQLAWIADVPLDARGKAPNLVKRQVLLAAASVAGKPGDVRLITRDAMQLASPALLARVRAVTAEATAPGAVPAVTGIASAFHTAGTIEGEGETQIFLSTRGGAPMSVTVLRRPGEPPRWAFAQGEIVDEAAAPPPRGTLAWYRLACAMPPALPDPTIAELGSDDASAARRDYAFVIEQLGPCQRTRAP